MKIIECPRDAMQGLPRFIPTHIKVKYLNTLLQVGFDTLDFGSFVSAKAIPQMTDTAEVLKKIKWHNSATKFLAIIANKRGALEASFYEQIHYLGYPFSISETFQKRNTNSTIDKSLLLVEEVQQMCCKANKQLVIYISMAFGNPYGDKWDVEVAEKWIAKLSEFEIKIIALADTVGVSTPGNITYLFKNLISSYPQIEFGAHLHSLPSEWELKVKAAFESGCTRFDSAIKGFGGCPMAKNELIGNIATENLVRFLLSKNVKLNFNLESLKNALEESDRVFSS